MNTEQVLAGKRIVLGITGGIAAYKAVDLASSLNKQGAQVKVIMTANAVEFINPITFEAISGYPVYSQMFARTGQWEIDHISLAKWAELLVVVPATANILGKVSHGIADDLLTTTIMATSAQCIFAPAMNTKMYNNPIVRDNIAALEDRGYRFIHPVKGRLACGDWGEGKMAHIDEILTEIRGYFSRGQDLADLKVLVTAGPTREYLDPVRFISNRSTGKMGFAIASACLERGARVDLVSGPTHIVKPEGANFYPVETGEQMYIKVMELFADCDVLFKAAAVGDYRPANIHTQKIKKNGETYTLDMVKNPDILREAGRTKISQVLVGFAAETQNMEYNALQKMLNKNLDFILANDITHTEAGFEADTNQGILYANNGEAIHIPLLNKKEFAHRLIDEVVKRSCRK